MNGSAGPSGRYAAAGEERRPFSPTPSSWRPSTGSSPGPLLLVRRRGRELPRNPAPGDLVLIGVASHKLSRLIGKDKVTSPLRAPFTELEGRGGPGEFEERSRGSGVRKAIGELLICPYCLGLWVVAAFSVGLLFSPRLTRFIASVFAALTLSDFLQIAYKAAEEKGLG